MTRREPGPTEAARIEAPATPKRTRSIGAQAGHLFEKLAELDAEERAELEASPEAIRDKFAGRREKALSGVSDDVRVLVAKMRDHQDDKGPESE